MIRAEQASSQTQAGDSSPQAKQFSSTTFISQEDTTYGNVIPCRHHYQKNNAGAQIRSQHQDIKASPINTTPNSRQPQPTAIVEPIRHHKKNNSQYNVSITTSKNSEQTLGQLPSQPTINCIEDIPDDMDSLTVEQLCDCLVLLSMDSYVDVFRTKQIDGALLAGFKEDMLTADLGFTEFQASKLMRVMRGWRPKLV